ncbi:hypothetical protein TEQG_04660 [Trichophyton equinum CBS 127.97]|uniref:Uncharacterized protein n=1 Tax=Trichophyton equinum (strain ATCC MYA-4606 / CBS 127.97) TaxID=559882 RepID=F2PUT3_TRIEC|nr:hypothetical protein TEQG_04660 [Trichophyton equinum CBS 127.97]
MAVWRRRLPRQCSDRESKARWQGKNTTKREKRRIRTRKQSEEEEERREEESERERERERETKVDRRAVQEDLKQASSSSRSWKSDETSKKWKKGGGGRTGGPGNTGQSACRIKMSLNAPQPMGAQTPQRPKRVNDDIS